MQKARKGPFVLPEESTKKLQAACIFAGAKLTPVS
jgi:hypothetical protein